jgi:hypothetical protein
MLSDEDASLLLATFPEVDYAFAYGSGAIKQGGYDYSHSSPPSPAASTATYVPGSGPEPPMLDFILAVEDSRFPSSSTPSSPPPSPWL